MVYLKHIEDSNGDLVELKAYCYSDMLADFDANPDDWADYPGVPQEAWGYESNTDTYCATCGEKLLDRL